MQKEQTEHTELETDADIIHAHRNNRMSILTDKMMDRLDLTEDIDDIDEDPFDQEPKRLNDLQLIAGDSSLAAPIFGTGAH